MNCTINESHGKVHAKGLCQLCYLKDYEKRKSEGRLEAKKQLAAAKQPGDDLTAIVKKVDGIKDKTVVGRARYVIEQFLFSPQRVGPIVQAFFNRALKNDKVLIEYMKMLVPKSDSITPVQVIINAPSITQKSGVTYDVTGEEVKSDTPMAKMVVSKV